MSDIPNPIAAGRWSAVFCFAQFALIWTTFFVLSSAIGWPASLGDPASVALPRLLDHRAAAMTGYGCYLLAALLLVPAVAALNDRLGLRGGVAGLTLALATLSAMAKAIGISRWLFAMPGLASAYMVPGADKAGIATVFETLNAYAGGIGEIVGVGLVSGALTILIGRTIAQAPGRAATLLGGFTLASGLLLFANIPAGFGVELSGVLTLSNIVWQFALLGIGLWSLTAPRR